MLNTYQKMTFSVYMSCYISLYIQWKSSTVLLMLYIYHVEFCCYYMHNRSISYYISDDILVHLNMDGYGNSYNYIDKMSTHMIQ